MNDYQRAAAAIRDADALLLTAGAGMGVDSGLPAFRTPNGFWRAYPALGRKRLDFTQVASPQTFSQHPRLAWGFYGHRLSLYRATQPHPGFQLLKTWASERKAPSFVFTSNVDGHFQRAGFSAEQILECHGSIHHLQCTRPCDAGVWPAEELAPQIDEETLEMTNELPRCRCGALARPNILMFGDLEWLDEREREQRDRFSAWLASHERAVIIECGAGTAIPTVRMLGERLPFFLIRINPDEPEVAKPNACGLRAGALEGLQRLAEALAGH